MTRSAVNIQDGFLNQARRGRIEVTVRLLDGKEYKGRITAFDNFTIVLSESGGGGQVLLYKHALASLIPTSRIRWTQQGGRPDGSRQGREDEESSAGGSDS